MRPPLSSRLSLIVPQLPAGYQSYACSISYPIRNLYLMWRRRIPFAAVGKYEASGYKFSVSLSLKDTQVAAVRRMKLMTLLIQLPSTSAKQLYNMS